MAEILLRTKQTVPPVRPDLVARERLLDRLNQGRPHGHKLTLISAPAGSGKTTLLSQFAALFSQPLAWLSLDKGDNNPRRFWTYLASTWQAALPGSGQGALAALAASESLPLETIPTLLINDLAQQSQWLVLVLDDFHVIHHPAIHEGLIFLVEYMPANLRLIVATRSDPPWPLARYRARSQLNEIRAQELRFNEDEAAEFFSQTMGLELPASSITALEARTEGWVAGLQLAAVSLRGRDDMAHFVQALTGSHLYIAEYLLEEVLQGQPEDVQSFLLKTSILDSMTPELCDAVTERRDGRQMLSALYQANLFIIPLDMEGKWYRYHHLFADLLQARLMQTQPPGAAADLHQRAASWYELNGMAEEAVQHWLAGKAYGQVAALIEQHGREMMFSGQANTLNGWLQELPKTVLQIYPRLQIYRLWLDLMQEKTEISPQALRRMENSLRSLPPSAENDKLQVELTAVLCRFVAFSGDTDRAIRLARDALEKLPDEEQALRARAYSALAVAYWFEGSDQQAKAAYEQTMSLALAAGNYSLAAHATFLMGMSQKDYGRLGAAARVYQSFIDLGQEIGQEPFLSAGPVTIGLAGIYLEWNELETAENYLRQGIQLSRLGGYGLSAGHTLSARLRQAQGDFQAAAAAIEALGETGVDPTGTARQILLSVARGDLDRALHQAEPWIRLVGKEDHTPQPPLLVMENVRVTLARLFLARGDLDMARNLLEQVRQTAEPDQRRGRLIEVYLLQALVDLRQNEGRITSQAIESLLRALVLGQPEGYVLTFLEEGTAVLPLLQAVSKREGTSAELARYVQRLIDLCLAPAVPDSTAGSGQPPGLVEPLTPREMEVLQLAASGLSNQAIAGELVITERTVKKHMTNILGKLGAVNRTQAAAKAMELGLIQPPQ